MWDLHVRTLKRPVRMPNRISIAVLAAVAPLTLAACATPSADEIAQGDPLEGVNRGMHGFNQALSDHVVAPIADAAESQAPESGRSGAGGVLHHAGNVLDNLGEPKNAMNGALQGNPEAVGTAVARFGLNSTVGLLGIYDVAGTIGLDEQKEDFGQTLGTWGAPPGPYMVAPIAGPTTTRDIAGSVVDSMLNPVSLLPIPSEPLSVARTGVKAANAADSAQTSTEAAQVQTDPYASAREQYERRRGAQIANVQPQRAMAPIEHREDAPPSYAAAGYAPSAPAYAPAASAYAAVPTPSRPGGMPAPAAGALDEPELSLAPRQPLVIDIYPMRPAEQAPAGRTPRPATYAD